MEIANVGVLILTGDPTESEQPVTAVDLNQISVQTIDDQAARADLRDVASRLRETLGSLLTAYLAGVRDTRTVTGWATGQPIQIDETGIESRLREAFFICELRLAAGDDASTIQTWIVGMNPELYDEAPVNAIREGRLREVHAAALAFAGGA